MEIMNYDNYLIYEDGSLYNKKNKRYLKPQIDKHGYKTVILSKNSKPKSFFVHRLIASAYIPNLDNKPIVDHINRKRDDNRLEKLRWYSSSENG